MSDQRFFDLAMKAIAQQASEAERAELDALLACESELRAEFERLRMDTHLVREVLPLVNATGQSAPELPAYARGRLQTKVRQTLGRPEPAAASLEEKQRRRMWRWRWLLGLATAVALFAVVAIPLLRQAPAPVIQVAMLDTAGASRGSDGKDLTLLQQTWNKATVDSFSSKENEQAWQSSWPGDRSGVVVKVVYDRPAGELRVLCRRNGKIFSKTWAVEPDLRRVLEEAKAFVQEQSGH
jgi:hypothetical protein